MGELRYAFLCGGDAGKCQRNNQQRAGHEARTAAFGGTGER
jgi:hypothetical protein